MSSSHNMSGENRRRRRQSLIRMYGEQCARCGSPFFLTIDHIIPRSCGGSNALDNLQLLCQECNEAKGQGMIDYRWVAA